mgnify:CR=1 FL=1
MRAWRWGGGARSSGNPARGTRTGKGGVHTGGRGRDWLGSNWLHWDAIIGKSLAETPVASRPLYYSQAWLLTPYMRSTPERGVPFRGSK